MSAPEEAGSARVTTELDGTTDTRPLETPPGGPASFFGDTGAWLHAATSAGLAWMAVLCIGAVCLLAPKLQFPTLASDSDPVEIFTGVVVMSLGLMRVPIHIGELTITALPLGALVGVAVSIAWAVAAQGLRAASARAAATVGVRVAAVFAFVGLLLALVFRIRGPETIAADAPWSLVLTFLWCALFATTGALAPPGRWVRLGWGRVVEQARRSPGSGLLQGVAMIAIAWALGCVALLLWVIVSVATGPSPGFGWGEAGAAVIYLIAFLPNVITALVALSVGAPLLQGAQIGVAGETIGPLAEISLLDWQGGPLAYALLLIPVIACTGGGWLLARTTQSRATAWRPVLVAAFLFAAFFALMGWIGEARVGAGLVRERGFARVAVLPVPTFAWGILWAAVFGWLGWELGLRNSDR